MLAQIEVRWDGLRTHSFSLAPSTLSLVRLCSLTRKIPNLSGGMKRGAVAIIGGIAALAQVTETAYVWPSQYDEIEDILYLQTGYRSRGFVQG